MEAQLPTLFALTYDKAKVTIIIKAEITLLAPLSDTAYFFMNANGVYSFV